MLAMLKTPGRSSPSPNRISCGLLLLILVSFADVLHGFKIDAREQQSQIADKTILAIRARSAKLINHMKSASNSNWTTTTDKTLNTFTTTPVSTTITTSHRDKVHTTTGAPFKLDATTEAFVAATEKTIDKSLLLQGQSESMFVDSKPSTRRPYFINFTSLIQPTKSSGVVQKKYVFIDKRSKANASETTGRSASSLDWSRRKSSELRVQVVDQPTINDRQRSKKKTLVKVKVVNGQDQILVYTSTTTPAPPTTLPTIKETTTNSVTWPADDTINDTVTLDNITLRGDNNQFMQELKTTTMITTIIPPTTTSGKKRLKTIKSTVTTETATTKPRMITTTTTTTTTRRPKRPVTMGTTVMPMAYSSSSTMSPMFSTEDSLDMFAPSSMMPEQYFGNELNSFSSTESPFSSSSSSYLDYSGEYGDLSSSTSMPAGIELLDKNDSDELSTSTMFTNGDFDATASLSGKNSSNFASENTLIATGLPQSQTEQVVDTGKQSKLSSLQIVLIGVLLAIGSIIFILVGALAYLSWSKLKITPEANMVGLECASSPVKIVMPPQVVDISNRGSECPPSDNFLQPPSHKL